MSEETVTFNLEVNVEKTHTSLRRLEFVFYRIFALLNRLGLPEQIDAAIIKIQRFIMTIRLLHTTIIMLQAASGPIGWAMAGVSGITTLIVAGEFVNDITYDQMRGT